MTESDNTVYCRGCDTVNPPTEERVVQTGDEDTKIYDIICSLCGWTIKDEIQNS